MLLEQDKTFFFHVDGVGLHEVIAIDVREGCNLETYPIGLATADSFDAESLANFIFEALADLELPWNQLLGGSADTTNLKGLIFDIFGCFLK